MWSKFKALSLVRKAAVVFGALVVLGIIGGATSPNKNSGLPAPSTPAKQSQTGTNLHKVQAIQVRTQTETKSIPFQSTTQNDSSLASGTTKVTTAGVNGVETITYKVTYTNGVQTSKVQSSDVVTTPPVTKITSIGTYVAPVLNCPNGTYVNSAGNTVCSPYSAPTAPAGVTAQCRDGTYSDSQSRSGTCSYHGGVATWL
jgi:hypothetical protein